MSNNLEEMTKVEKPDFISAFVNSASDASNLEATQQEQFSVDFNKFINTPEGEALVVSFIDAMCIQSTSPDLSDSWQKVRTALIHNRSIPLSTDAEINCMTPIASFIAHLQKFGVHVPEDVFESYFEA